MSEFFPFKICNFCAFYFSRSSDDCCNTFVIISDKKNNACTMHTNVKLGDKHVQHCSF